MTTAGGHRHDGRSPAPPSPAGVLADRIAAALVHHEPGWRLPRLTALARRYDVSAAEVDAAIGELAARHLLRRLPDGQVYRASPAEYQLSLEGLDGLSSYVDPMGGALTCRSRQVSSRRVPEDAGRALGLAPGETVLVVKCLWLVGGEPGALSATYLPPRLASLAGDFGGSPLPAPGGQEGGELAATPGVAAPPGVGDEWSADQAEPAVGERAPAGTGGWPAGTPPAGRPSAVLVELGPPPPSVARSLRLAAGQPVATVTVRFADPSANRPVALTMVMLRPDLFRIVVQTPHGQRPAIGGNGLPSAWTQAAEGWEP